MQIYPTALQKYLDHPTCHVRKETSRASMRSTIRLFQQDHGELELHEATKEQLQNWLHRRLIEGVSPSTLVKNAQRLDGLFEWAWRQGLRKDNPASGLRRELNLRSQPVRVHEWLSKPQVEAVLASVVPLTSQDLRDLLIMRLGFTAGLRNNEIRTLPMSSLEKISGQRITVVGKGRQACRGVGTPQ